MGKDDYNDFDDKNSDENVIHIDFFKKSDEEEFSEDDYSVEFLEKRKNYMLVKYVEESRRVNEIVTLSSFISILLATFIFMLLFAMLILVNTTM